MRKLINLIESVQAEQLDEAADTGMYNPSKSEPVYQKMQTFLAFAVKQGFTDIKHIQDPNTFDMLASRLAQSGVDLTEQLDEVNWKKAAATALAVASMAGASNVDSAVTPDQTHNQPVATQSISTEASKVINTYWNKPGGFTGSVQSTGTLKGTPEGKLYSEMERQLLDGYLSHINTMEPEQQTGMTDKAYKLSKENALVYLARHLTDTNPGHEFINPPPNKIINR